ncbi:DUF2321 domain-containing protein [Aquabacterium sp. A3]|uniref:DUF2321 domain-containing protein n=1 Tax=Aquabacterium sp. A3 TaxID=3132829 RepID=UPI00404B0B5B
MGYYDTQQVCLNGHQITDRFNSSPQFRRNFCSSCGEKTIHECPACHSPIPGDYHADGAVFIGFPTPVPTHCENCGHRFPWSKLDPPNLNKIQIYFSKPFIWHKSLSTMEKNWSLGFNCFNRWLSFSILSSISFVARRAKITSHNIWSQKSCNRDESRKYHYQLWRRLHNSGEKVCAAQSKDRSNACRRQAEFGCCTRSEAPRLYGPSWDCRNPNGRVRKNGRHRYVAKNKNHLWRMHQQVWLGGN